MKFSRPALVGLIPEGCVFRIPFPDRRQQVQTGFDQLLLHTMYVDKKLGGVNAVQTLSRLNRIHPGKEETFVLDFANDAEEIRKAFQPYYETTLLKEATDPNKLYDIKRMLEDYRIFGRGDVEAFAGVYFSEKGKQERLHPILSPVVDEYAGREEEEREGFRKHLGDYVRIYAFLSQILTFSDADLEKLYQFARFLLRKLPVDRERLPVEITENINMDSYRIQQTSKGDIKLLSEGGGLQPLSEIGTGQIPAEEKVPLSEILGYINEYYGTQFTDEDRVAHFAEDMQRRMSGKEDLLRAFDPEVNPSREHRKMAFDPFFEDILHDMIDSNFDLYKKIVEDERFGDLFREFVFERVERNLRRRPG
jgi:type I restriction enzyme R subunit